MAKPVIVRRDTKGSSLTHTEVDTNFQNLRDATIDFTDGTQTLSIDLNDVTLVQGRAEHLMQVTVTDDSTGQSIEVDNLLGDLTQEPQGFENRTDSIISFDAATRTFSIEAGSNGYAVYVQGRLYTKTSTESVIIDNTTGLYYIYFDPTATLQFQTDYFDFSSETPVAYIYWNATTGTAPYFADERHGVVMDWRTHEYLHRTRGAAYANGFAISAYTTTGDGSLDSDAEFDLSNGVFFDEDIDVAVTHSDTPVANTWQQDLQGPARIPVFYHSGSTGAWVKDTAGDFAVKTGTSLVTYNLNTAGTWSTPDVSNTFYVAYFIVATNNLNEPVISIMGQSAWNKLDDAQNQSNWADLDLTNFPSLEFRPLYRIIFRSSSSYTNTPRALIAAVQDLRLTTAQVTAAASLAPNAFGTVSVAGQASIIADTVNDTLTVAAGTGISITTDDSTDTLTITNTSTGTTYDLTAENTSTGDAFIALTGSDATVDTVQLVAGAGIEIEKTAADRIEFRQVFATWDNLGTLTWDDLG